MAHPQNSPRGLLSKWNLLVPAGKGLTFKDYSNGTALLTADSTGIVVAGGMKVGGQRISSNSTASTFPGPIVVSAQATRGKLSANSTALILPNSVRVGALASYITANSTGIKIGSKYISTNSTGN